MPRLFRRPDPRSYGYTTDILRRTDGCGTHRNRAGRAAGVRSEPVRRPFATAEKRLRKPARGIFPVPPASPFRNTVNRLLHRISTRKIKDLSTRNFDAAVLFPCGNRSGLGTCPYRNGSQDTGRGAKASVTVGWEDRASANSDPRRKRNAGGSRKVFGPEPVAVSQGLERAARGFRALSGCGGSLNRRKLVGMPGDGRTDQEGVRRVARPMQGPRPST